jgi:hypothetical protein
LRNTSRSKFTQIPFIFISKNPRKAEKILGKIPKSIGPQTLLESFYFQILGSLENLSQIIVLRNSLKFTFLPSQIFYNFLGIFGFFPNYFGHPNFLIHFPKNRNQFLMDFLFNFLFQPSRPAHSFSLGLPASPSHPAHQPSAPPSLPDHRGPPAFILLRPSGQAEPRRLPVCAVAPEAPRPPPPSVQDPPLLPPLIRSRYPPSIQA